jgi:hypothetical protein
VRALADTGVLFALMDDTDKWHPRVQAWFATATVPVVVPTSVVTETALLTGSRLGARAESAFLRAVAAGEFTHEQLEHEDVARAADLVEQYADFTLGIVDASIVAVAERLDVTTLLTTDRRHFGVVRPVHCARLRLVP